MAVAGHKQIIGLLAFQNIGPALFDVLHDGLARKLAKRYQPFFVALARHAQHSFVQAQMKGLEPDQLADPQAAGVHHFQHGAVALPQRRYFTGRGQQRFNLRLAHQFGNPQRLPGRLQFEGGVYRNEPLAQCPGEVAF